MPQHAVGYFRAFRPFLLFGASLSCHVRSNERSLKDVRTTTTRERRRFAGRTVMKRREAGASVALSLFPTDAYTPPRRVAAAWGTTSCDTSRFMSSSNTQTSPALRSDACGLERLPHLVNKVCLLWGQPECDAYINRLIMDSRDGNRQGLPWEAALELLFLAELSVAKRALVASTVTGVPFPQMFEHCRAQACATEAGPWANEPSRTDRKQVDRPPSARRPKTQLA
jgi:hypothetical protein